MEKFYAYKQLFEDYMSEVLSEQQTPRGLYEPVDYIMNLGGKRVRPVLVMMGYALFDKTIENCLPAALSVELFHNFSLLHDDIMDEADTRRGKPTVHKTYGVNAGILSGDVMLVQAYQQLEKLPASHLPKALSLFNEMAAAVCEGQQLDTDFERLTKVSETAYLQMIGGKTAALIAASLAIGSLLAGAKQEEVKQVYRFGYDIGIAFQIMDDYLDAYGDEALFGKKKGGDIIQNKKTYLYVLAFDKGNAQQKALLTSLFTEQMEPAQKIKHVMRLFEELEVEKSARIAAAAFEEKARHAIASVNADSSARNDLLALSERLLFRNA